MARIKRAIFVWGRLPDRSFWSARAACEPDVRIGMIRSQGGGDGVQDLKRHLAMIVPSGPWLFPADQLSDAPERWLAAEVTREQVFLQLHDELPYAATVETESWEERRDGSARIEQVIYVQRPTQRAIVLGEGGRRIKAIGARARAELEQMFDRRIHLFLFVKVRENWVEDPERYAALGLDYNA